MRYLDVVGYNPMPDKKVVPIFVRQLGFAKSVYVRTRLNGGIK